MRVCKAIATLALVVLTASMIARADDNDNSMGGNDENSSPDQLENPETPPPPPAPAAPAAPQGAIMQGFDAMGIGKPMTDLGFYIKGYGEVGYLYDFTTPTDLSVARTYYQGMPLFAGDYKNSFILDQLDLSFGRDMVNLAKGDWDGGFKIEVGYGADDFYTHSNGILDNNNKEGFPSHPGGPSGPDDQFDLLQAYVTLGIPVGEGITLQAGKFLSLLGYEQIDPTQNLFYTHSYAFSFGAEPYTMTGGLVKYTYSDPTAGTATTFIAGIIDGWNQSTDDVNREASGVFQIKSTSGNFDFTTTLLEGPEWTEEPGYPPNHSNWWTVPELTGTWRVSDQFSTTLDMLYGDAPNYPTTSSTHVSAQWFSAAAYVKYQLDPHLAIGTRIEWFYDRDGIVSGAGAPDISYYEATFGVQLSPLPDSPLFQSLTFRPEIRYDWSTHRGIDPSIVPPDMLNAHYSALIAAIDAYFRF